MTIHKKIVQVLRGVSAIEKQRMTQSNAGSYRYRSTEDILENLHPEIEKAGIYIYPSKIKDFTLIGRTSKSGHPVMQCTFLQEFCVVDADSGESITLEVATEGVDATAGDKATAIARTYAFKAALTQLFFIVCREIETQSQVDQASLLPASVKKQATQQIAQQSETITKVEDVLFVATTQAQKNKLWTLIRDGLVARRIAAENNNVLKVYNKVHGKCKESELSQRISESVEELLDENLLTTID